MLPKSSRRISHKPSIEAGGGGEGFACEESGAFWWGYRVMRWVWYDLIFEKKKCLTNVWVLFNSLAWQLILRYQGTVADVQQLDVRVWLSASIHLAGSCWSTTRAVKFQDSRSEVYTLMLRAKVDSASYLQSRHVSGLALLWSVNSGLVLFKVSCTLLFLGISVSSSRCVAQDLYINIGPTGLRSL